MKKLTIIALAIAMAFSLQIAQAQAPELTAAQKYENELQAWLTRLEWDESHNNEKIIVLDSNNRYSYGCLQFQLATFTTYARKYAIKGEIGSCEAQKELAEAMIKDNWNNWSNWYNSVKYKTAGYPPKAID